MTTLRVPTPADIISDAAKHAWCKERNGLGAVILSPNLYDAAEAAGYDMRYYVPARLLPTTKGPSTWPTLPEADDRRALHAKPRS